MALTRAAKRKKARRWGILAIATLLAGATWGTPRRTAAEPPATDHGQSESRAVIDLTPTLKRMCTKHTMPAIGAVGIKERQVWGRGVAGVRRSGVGIPVERRDLWDAGSCAMVMTATLAGVLVDQGLIAWESTIAQILPEIAETAREEYRDATLAQLLTHASALPEDDDLGGAIWKLVGATDGTPPEQRLTIAKIALRQAPDGAPGAQQELSYLGYTIAGAMMERAAGAPFEVLMRERVFAPLGMTSARFGAPDEKERPVGHEVQLGRWLKPAAHSSFPEPLSPAGNVYCSIDDLAKLAMLHLRGAKGESGLLVSPESFRVMHSDLRKRTRFAMGWQVTGATWGGGAVLLHASSQPNWKSVIAIAPATDAAFVVVTNRGDQKAEIALHDCIAAMAYEQLETE